MAYHAKKVIEKITPKQRFLKLITFPELSLVKKNDIIVLLDDFSGTGKSIKEFYENNIKSYIEGKNIKICALTVAFLEHARLLLETELNINVYGDVYYPAFMRRGSVFGYEKNMIPIREFCFKKGEILFPNWKSTDMKPLGFMNSQALVCFEHTTPNNTLPIIWYDNIIPGTNKEWHGLFPRFTNSRIERGRRMRLASNFWLSAISRLNFNNIEWSRNHTVESLRLISYIAQKYHGKSDLYIAQILGISISDIEEIIKLGKEKQLVDNEGDITTKAKNIYEEIRKKDKILEHSSSKKIINKNIDKVYVPKSFRGIT